MSNNRFAADSLKPRLRLSSPWPKLGMALALGAGTGATIAQETTLGSFGRTELQARTGDAVQRVCSGFASGNVAADTPEKQDLFTVCRSMVQTANDLADTGPTQNSLGIDADALAFALQQVTSEETIAPSTALTETSFGQLNSLFSRLVSLRGGAGGATLGMLGNGVDGQRIGFAGLATGGSAGEGMDWGRLGAFLNVHLGSGEVDASDRQDGFDYDLQGLVVGADYRLNDQTALGMAFSYSHLDSDFNRSPTVAGGGLEADGYNLALYGTWYQDDLYLSGVLGYGRTDFELDRRIIVPSNNPNVPTVNRTASADTDSRQWLLSLSAGYEQSSGALTYGPYLRVDYLDAKIDGYSEEGALGLNLRVDDFDVESLVGTVGARVSYAVSRNFGVLLPQARAEWHHEFQNDSQTIEARYLNDPQNILLAVETDDPDRSYFSLGVGVSGVFANGIQGFVDYEAVIGQDDVEDHLVTAGVRWEF